MSRRVVTTPAAERQIASVDAWWRTHRASAPSLFLTELEKALRLLEEMPFAGAPYRPSPFPGFRRLLLRETRYHVYYVVVDEAVLALAVWHASRGAGPTLRPRIELLKALMGKVDVSLDLPRKRRRPR